MQLQAWHEDVNGRRAWRATGRIPGELLLAGELGRLRPVKRHPDQLDLRFPVQVGPTGMVTFQTACRCGLMLCVESCPHGDPPPVSEDTSRLPPFPPTPLAARPARSGARPTCLPFLARSPVAGTSSAAASGSSPTTAQTTLQRPVRAPPKAFLPFRSGFRVQAIPIACHRRTPSDSLLSTAATRSLLLLLTAVYRAADHEMLFDMRWLLRMLEMLLGTACTCCATSARLAGDSKPKPPVTWGSAPPTSLPRLNRAVKLLKQRLDARLNL